MAVVEVKINGLAVDAQAKSHVVILKEKDGERVLPIWIGPAEAQAIARELAGQRFQRPLTHDLIATIVEGLKARVTRVVIADLKDNTFFAQLLVDREGEVVVIDARPSESLAVALRCGADIFVNEKLLAEPGEQDEPTEEEKAQELRKFLENLDPEDFGKYNP
jgi:bifunctional DNase/RNase